MTEDQRQRLRNIKSFQQLVAFLRDELDWPIEPVDDEDDLTFDWTDDLGFEASAKVDIKEIKQLRPLESGQPWGIFFISFEKKRLPIVILRRILNALVMKKRASANKAHRAAWKQHDLLFISRYGESNDPQLTFAHFSEPRGEFTDIKPTLRVLGWDDEDANLKLDYVADKLKENLTWPEQPIDLEAWRKRWSEAFELRHRQVIDTSADLALRLAELARHIRNRMMLVLPREHENGTLRKLMKGFKTALIHDLDEGQFADMYAQTITYGLFSAAVSRTVPGEGTAVVQENVVDMVPVTNPFLKEMLQSFLKAGGRRGKLDFDELGIQEVVDLLRDPKTRLDLVLKDFGNRTRQEDPVIHFYEYFLKAYDRDLKVRRGVFYTPQPVVSYIVRSVHELLQTEFGLADGLADTTTWGEMLKKHPDIKLPPLSDEPGEKNTISSEEPFVQILDPATGTATFLVEVIDVIYRTLAAKWKQQRLTEAQQRAAWNDYVPKHLLPRLHGYELMMAPYAIAHMKIGLKLAETGYRFGAEERARIYLTNALEPWVKQLPLIGFDALAHEAEAVNRIKRDKRFTVVIGNPPYSRVSQNQIAFIQKLLKDYKEPVSSEANQQPLDDDYIKCLRLAHYLQSTATCGIIGFITNHTVISGILFRGVRQRLLEDQNIVAVLDLHGNSNIKERCADGSKDENVFDIQAGVAVTIGAKAPWLAPLQCVFHELWGLRDAKYAALVRLSLSQVSHPLAPTAPYFFLKPIDLSAGDELKGAFSLPHIFPSHSSGLMTVRDNLAIGFDRDELHERFEMFRSSNVSDAQFQAVCPVSDYRRWSLSEARRNVRADKKWEKRMEIVNYRPFDKRWIFYSPDIITYPNFRVMDQFKRRNLGLISSRIHKGEEHAHEFATRQMTEIIFLSSKSSNNAFLFPLYTFYMDGDLAIEEGGLPNFSREFLKQVATNLNLSQQGSDLPKGLTPEDIFHYAYAVLHSPGYRSRYAELLKFEFPRLPLTGNLKLFRALARLGGELVALHLMESRKLDKPRNEFIGRQNPEVGSVAWADETVWIDAPACRKSARQQPGSIGFRGVPEAVWNFHIGGYQVCHKWLKDRKGRTLSKDDIAHYHKIVIALAETIRLMAEIDKVIDQHGGWPAAFQSKN